MFYVGQTSNPAKRHKAHAGRNAFAPDAKTVYVQRLRELGFQPCMEIIETVREDRAFERERYWINWYSIVGCPLTNGESLNWRRKCIDTVGAIRLPTKGDSTHAT